eukprot:scaffold22737_cov32-Tisochrysis_lutea.AAC.2
MRVLGVHLARTIAQVDAEVDQHQVQRQECQGIRQGAVGQYLACAMPSLLLADSGRLENLEAVIRRSAQGPSQEYSSIEHDKHSHISEVVVDWHPNVAHRRIHEQHGHTPQFSNQRAKCQRVADEEVPDLPLARGV